MIDPDQKTPAFIGRKGLAHAAAQIGRGITKDGMAVDLKDGGPPVVVPADLVKELTGQDMPKRALRCKRTRHRKKAGQRRKQAKASRRNNR